MNEEIKELENKVESLRKKLKEKEETERMLRNYLNVQDLKFNVLQTIGKLTAGSFQIEKLLNSIMDTLVDALKVEAASLLLINEETNLLEFIIAKGKKGESVKKYKLKIGDGIGGWVAQTGEGKIIPDLSEEPHYRKDISDEIGFEGKSMLCVPLKIQDKVIGVIEAINKNQSRHFIKDDFELLISLAGQIALVVENVRLFSRTQTKLDALSTMIEVCAIINSTLNLEEVLTRIMDSATLLLNAETSSIFLVDEKKEELYVTVATGEIGKKIKHLHMPITSGIAGWVLRRGEVLIINDVQNDHRYYKSVEEKTGFSTKSMLAVPLITKGRRIGVIEVINKIGEKFTNSDLELLKTFSNQSAIAIDNAILHSIRKKKKK